MHAPLFRPEVAQAQQAQALGGVRIARNPQHELVAAVALGLAGLLVAFAAWGEVARKVRVPGVLMPAEGLLQVAAPAAGTIAEVRVAEADVVRAGDVLFVLSTDRGGAAGDTAARVAHSLQERRAALQAEVDLRATSARQREQALADRLRALEAERAQADEEVRLAERRAELAEQGAERVRRLAGEGFVSDQQVRQREQESLDARLRVQAARRAWLALQREQHQIGAELAAAPTLAQAELTQLRSRIVALQQDAVENDARRELVVRAPRDGLVSVLHRQKGQPVQPGETLASFVPHGERGGNAGEARRAGSLVVELHAPASAIGLVKQGQPVRLRFTAYPHQKFGVVASEVIDIGDSPMAANLRMAHGAALAHGVATTGPVYRVTARFDPAHVPPGLAGRNFRVGMTVEADLMQERRAVWEWLMEPLLRAAPRPAPDG